MSERPTDPRDPMSAHAEVERTDRIGSLWFMAALLADAVVVGAVLIGGWRPDDLAVPAVWWIGAALNVVGLAGIGYAGCPIYWGNVVVAHAQKSVSIRAGLVLFLIGGAVAAAALLAG